MKKLIALKPCSFGGKKFFIGNEIPTDLVLDPKAQEMMGILAVVEVESEEQAPEEEEESTADSESEDAAPDEGGRLLPPSSTLEDVAPKATYSKTALSQMKKAELLEVAAELGVEADATMKNDAIAELIIEKQG